MSSVKLELFDFDEILSSEADRLAQLTNKCKLLLNKGDDSDLDYYILEAANILGISNKSNNLSSKDILGHVFESIVKWKMPNKL